VDLTVRAANDLASVDPAAWNGLEHGASPFLEHGFLRALEVSESIGPEAGWAPVYLLAEVAEPTESGATGARLVGAVPCFIKSHSYGEYIFDWGWARAASRAGIPYYPKLVIAAPVTPATGRRILLRRDMQDADRRAVALALVEAVRALADAADCSSIHWLFTTEDEHALLAEAGFMSRLSFQFHFRNQVVGPTGAEGRYADFDAFLDTLASRKRKQIRKERRRALESVDCLEFVPGSEWSDHDVDVLDRFYRSTVNRHYGQDYLQPGFFHQLRRWLPERVQFARARQGAEIVAGALYFETDQALYGRYWGCARQIEFLHFETAYYAGIERCIQRGLPLFEAGAQGEHKLLRGFAPAPTYSSHSIRHPALRDAVKRFLEEEANALPSYMKELQQFTPYKAG
jgi:predicted N-acyltransferase